MYIELRKIHFCTLWSKYRNMYLVLNLFMERQLLKLNSANIRIPNSQLLAIEKPVVRMYNLSLKSI